MEPEYSKGEEGTFLILPILHKTNTLKTLLFTLLATIILPQLTFAQPGIAWEPEIIVSDGAVYGKIRPRAALVGDEPIVVYAGFGAENIFISRWNGTGFDTNPVLPTGTSSYAATWTGPDIAAKGDTVIAVFKLNPSESGNVYVIRSVDGGQNFSDTIRVGNYTGGNPWMPSLEIDDNGNPTVAIMIHDGQWANPRQALFHSNDAGLSFGPAEEISSNVPGEACDCCPSEVVIDGSHEVLLMRNNDNNIREVFGILSTDGGTSFPFTENVDQLNWNISQCPATGMDGYFLNDELFTTFSSRADGTYRVYVSRSDISSGLSMTERLSVPAPTNGGQNYPTMSGANDTIVMAWEERIGTNKEIYYSLSVGSNPLNQLSTLKSQANATALGNQTNPDILYKNGYVHLFYQDDANGNVVYRRGRVTDVANITESNIQNVVISPNPSSNNRARITGIRSITSVVSLDGKELRFQTSESKNQIELEILQKVNGVHFIHCKNDNGDDIVLRWMVL